MSLKEKDRVREGYAYGFQVDPGVSVVSKMLIFLLTGGLGTELTVPVPVACVTEAAVTALGSPCCCSGTAGTFCLITVDGWFEVTVTARVAGEEEEVEEREGLFPDCCIIRIGEECIEEGILQPTPLLDSVHDPERNSRLCATSCSSTFLLTLLMLGLLPLPLLLLLLFTTTLVLRADLF